MNLFAKIIRFSPVVPVMGSDSVPFQPVAVEAVGAAFVRALAEPRANGQTYDLCGPQSFTLPEMIDQILAVLGRKRLKLRIPNGIARCQAAILEFIFPRLLRKAAPLNRAQLVMLQEHHVGNAAPANELFGLSHLPFRGGIARYLRK